jgi:hypothetical protein
MSCHQTERLQIPQLANASRKSARATRGGEFQVRQRMQIPNFRWNRANQIDAVESKKLQVRQQSDRRRQRARKLVSKISVSIKNKTKQTKKKKKNSHYFV